MVSLRVVFTSFIVFLSAACFSQQQLSAGLTYSQPVGAYGSTSLSDGGFAEPGWGLLFESKTAQPNWPFGLQLGFHFSYQEHEFSQSELTRAFDQYFQELFGNDQYSTLISIGYYKPLIMTLGPFYDFHLSEEWTVNIKSGLGVLFVNMDPMRFNILDQNNEIIAQEVLEFEGNAVFTYFIGGAISYKLSDDWQLGFSVDHSAAEEDITTTFSRGSAIDASQRISILNLGLQLSYEF